MSFTFMKELPTPKEIKEEYPLSEALQAEKAKREDVYKRQDINGTDRSMNIFVCL